MRLAALGAVPTPPQRMPMAQRKGIEKKKNERENERRREAREGGILVERKGGKPRERRKRKGKGDEDVGGPSVGKWRGGTLILGGKELRDIQGSRSSANVGKRKKR